MIRRFVEQKEVDLREQHAREHRPVLLPAAEFMNRPLPIRFREANAGQHTFYLRVKFVAVRVLVVVLQRCIFFEQAFMIGRLIAEIVLDGPHLPLDLQHLGKRRLDVIEQRHSRLGIEMLADVADREPGCANDLAAIGFLLVQQQLEERRLSGADEADFLGRIVLPRDAAEDVVRTIRFLDVFEAIKHGLTVNS